jgi:phenylpropionate dioxygenase-like ring-hydroxylating dioxygenase large terminal subunit
MKSGSHTPFLEVDRARRRFRVDRRAYSDEAVFRRERDIIFRRCWLYAGHGSELARPGDFVTRTIGGYDLILIRSRHGAVQAFFNACTHRGSTVCREPSGNARVLTCPYHGWVFDANTGALRDQATKTGYPEDFNAEGLYDLRRVPRLESYRDFYFVNYDAEAVELVDYLAAAWVAQSGRPCAVETSMAKLFVADTAVEIAIACQQVMGAYGLAEGHDMERHVRDLLGMPIVGGSSNMQTNNLAGGRGLRGE